MTKAEMKLQYDNLEKEISQLTETSTKLRAFIGSQDFKDLSDLEAMLTITQHHQLEAYARVLTMRAALFGGRLQDPDGEKIHTNDETPNPLQVPDPPEFTTGHSMKVGNTIITEG